MELLTRILEIEVYIAGIGILDVFGSCDFDLDLMTFIYDLDPYCLEIYRTCQYKLPIRQGFRKLSDRQTESAKIINHAAVRGWSVMSEIHTIEDPRQACTVL